MDNLDYDSKQILEASQDAFIAIDEAGIIKLWNKAAETLFGWPREEIIGRALTDTIIPVSHQAAHKKGFAHFLATGEGPVLGKRLELPARHREGHEFPIEITISVVPLRQGRIFAAFLHDITERKQAQTQLEAMTTELSRSNKELEQFSYAASHDLQEPLRTLRGAAQLLSQQYKGRLDADADKMIQFIVCGASRLQTLITDLLTYARIGKGEHRVMTLTCATLLQSVLDDLSVAVEESHAVITWNDLPTLEGNHTDLVLLFQNLLDNAIKYRGSALPKIDIGASQEGSVWRFSVRDNGIGINPTYAEKIFEPFARLHGVLEYPGSGLGLAICKKIVEHNGGKIWMESALGQGATVYFTYPVANRNHGESK